jgi:D-alanyl-D-alanine carboxypeptidase
VVIGTTSNKHRFQETAKLINWCIAQNMKKKGLIPILQQGNSTSAGFRTGSQSGQGANISSLAKVGNNVMMNMSATKTINRNSSKLNNG